MKASAAPPIAIIAEELGYFPVRNSAGDVVYIPKKVKRESTDQAIQLAKYMRQHNIVMAGTYWCPHTSRQKELFGAAAWNELEYVECSSKGYNGNPKLCARNKVDGYPTWIIGNGKLLPGELPLSEIAEAIGFKGFDEELEAKNPPPLLGSSCKQQ